MPVMRSTPAGAVGEGAVRVGGGRVGVVTVGLQVARRATDRSWLGQGPGRSMGSRRDPYLAGGPARTWHLADLASVGCRGFNGPVPQPSLDTCSSVVPGMLRGRSVRGQGTGSNPSVPPSVSVIVSPPSAMA